MNEGPDGNPRAQNRSRFTRRNVLLALAAGASVLFLLVAARHFAHDDARIARRAVRARRFGDARDALARWLRADPGSADAHLLKAQVAFAEGRDGEATVELKDAYERGARGEAFERLRGLLLVRRQCFAEAEPILLREFNAARTPDPEVDEALTIIYLESNRTKEVAWVLDRWMRDAPDDARPYFWRTELARRSPDQDVDQVESHYREALKRDPNFAPAQLGLAELLRTSNRHDEAATYYDSYLAQRPDDPTGHLGAARSAMARGEQDRAMRHLARALTLAPDDKGALLERARIEFRRGKAADALKSLDHAIRSDPFDADLLSFRARVLTRLGRAEDALADQERLRQLKRELARFNELSEQLFRDPENLSIQYEVAHWLFKHGRAEAGVRLARKILKVNPNHLETNRLMADYHTVRGEDGLANYYRLTAGSTTK